MQLSWKKILSLSISLLFRSSVLFPLDLQQKKERRVVCFFFALSTRRFSWIYSIYSIHFKIDFAHSTNEVDFPTLSHWASLQWQSFQRTFSVTFVDWLMTRPFSDALIDAFKYLQYGSIPPFPYLYYYARMLRSRDTRQHFFLDLARAARSSKVSGISMNKCNIFDEYLSLRIHVWNIYLHWDYFKLL